MNICELIEAVGVDKVGIQFLDRCADSLNFDEKRGTRITFVTEEPLNLQGTERLGMVVWLDRKAVDAAQAEPKAKGAPISDWAWWVGSDDGVKAEGLYDLYEAGSRDDAVAWAECHVEAGDHFHVIEARTRQLRDGDDYLPFAGKRNHAIFVMGADGNAVECSA